MNNFLANIYLKIPIICIIFCKISKKKSNKLDFIAVLFLFYTVFIFTQQSYILPTIIFFSFSFHANTFLGFFGLEKKRFSNYWTKCGLVDVRVKQFVLEKKKVNGPLGTIGLVQKSTLLQAIPRGKFFADYEPPLGHDNNTCAYIFYSFFLKQQSNIERIEN